MHEEHCVKRDERWHSEMSDTHNGRLTKARWIHLLHCFGEYATSKHGLGNSIRQHNCARQMHKWPRALVCVRVVLWGSRSPSLSNEQKESPKLSIAQHGTAPSWLSHSYVSFCLFDAVHCLNAPPTRQLPFCCCVLCVHVSPFTLFLCRFWLFAFARIRKQSKDWNVPMTQPLCRRCHCVRNGRFRFGAPRMLFACRLFVV